MKVKVIERYRDLELDEIKEPGDIFEARKDRAEVLLRKGFVEEIKEPKPKKEEPAKK
ncbi:hypothetical protein NE619_18045 [Anaerovorax odorimutans]|uniref:Uncharacterized protein n=1 Tax=Anaerovorax odorimutans TaxID=109327 RepID=A0ABT1RTW5_9FIRM|nr:hypothetical protein [Anaerovorax odorimutans]MCQ4638633.1 hypothetical protein [Anaerovorax odorimutans]